MKSRIEAISLSLKEIETVGTGLWLQLAIGEESPRAHRQSPRAKRRRILLDGCRMEDRYRYDLSIIGVMISEE